MRKIPGAVVDTAGGGFRVRGAAVADVRFTGGLWRRRRDTVLRATLPAEYEQCAVSGRLDNFRRAAGAPDIAYAGKYYGDSDVYKWMEAVAWSLADGADTGLRRRLDDVIGLVAAAQGADGYLNTYFSRERAGQRFTDLPVGHEMYCTGHLIQAAVAHHRTTGSTRLLDVACRAADHLDATFGPAGRPGADGHPNIEMALVELYRTTGEHRYLALARWFVEQHGRTPRTGSGLVYHQDHLPLADQREAVGHVVRAVYLYCAGADLDAETGEGRYRPALEALWRDVYTTKAYVTGGLGARWEDEAFGAPYELPGHRAYAETCAAVAAIMWNWRMFLASGEARYADEIDRALHNAVLPGLSDDGARFFYQNPLADEGAHRRVPWFATACCPPNIARLITSLPGYVYGLDDEGVRVCLYAESDADLATVAGPLRLRQRTGYPHDGRVRVEIRDAPDAELTLRLRIPSWAAGATVELNGAAAGAVDDGWWRLRRRWRAGDAVVLDLPYEPRVLAAHPRVTNLTGRVALARGPLVYCVEAADNPAAHPSELVLDPGAPWRAGTTDEGYPALSAPARAVRADPPLYEPVDRTTGTARDLEAVAVPYYLWANRAPGPMAVWLRRDPRRPVEEGA